MTFGGRRWWKRTPYGEVLGDPIHLKNAKTFRYIVMQLAAVSFVDSSLDSKGAAFEYFVRATLKGKKLGQYFTPRQVVRLMSTLVGREKIYNSLRSGEKVKVLDPACGTGGFLVYLMQECINYAERDRKGSKLHQKVGKETLRACSRTEGEGLQSVDCGPSCIVRKGRRGRTGGDLALLGGRCGPGVGDVARTRSCRVAVQVSA
jgi:hypothetical protein